MDQRILFICTGNICRSPTAEGVLRARVERSGLTLPLIDSAGTHACHAGEPPDARSIRHAARRGIDLSSLRARKVEPEDFERFDLLLAMDEGHLRYLQRMGGAASAAKVHLFLEYAQNPRAREVPDPYYGDPEDFERVLDLVEDAAERLLARLGRV